MKPVVVLEGMHAGYGKVEVLRGVDLTIGATEVVTVLGPNGAGKSSLIRSLIGGLTINDGTVEVFGKSVVGEAPPHVIRRGVAVVPEGRGTFNELSVHDNLRLGALTRRAKESVVSEDIDRCLDLFKGLAGRTSQTAGTLSGGEQQMLAIARALMARPRLLLLDEPSLGLAPLIIDELFRQLQEIVTREEMAILIVEQQAQHALDLADRAYVLEAGEIVLEGTSDDIRSRGDLVRAYLGA